MESKPKKRQVRKGSSAIPAQEKLPKPERSAEALIRHNGDLVEALFETEVWTEIVLPLLKEQIAGVSGRFTNNRFYKGSFTKLDGNISIERLAGYQMALEDFHNNLHDFIVTRDRLKEKKKAEDLEKRAPVFNPFLEEKKDYED